MSDSELKMMSLADIKPYPGNPRKVTDEAVQAIADSIEEYGYQQPMVVDKGGVLIVGHTRYQALLKLGKKNAQVYVSDMPHGKATEYRLLDNRIGEMSGWDHESLVQELREFETALVEEFFPSVDLEIESISTAAKVGQQDVDDADDKIKAIGTKKAIDVLTVVCPQCMETFQVRADSLPK